MDIWRAPEEKITSGDNSIVQKCTFFIQIFQKTYNQLHILNGIDNLLL
jgi:hypothetical protein